MKRLNELRKNKKGFTLMEMIVVIVIIGILMAILVPGIIRWIDKAKEKQIEANGRSVYLAVQGEIISKYETMTLEEAIDAVMKNQAALDEVLVEAGAKQRSVKFDEIKFDNNKNPSQITTFIYYSGKKKATYNAETGVWKIDPAE